LFAQPIWATRPPEGYARPPIHIRGNATTAPTGLSPALTRHAYGFDKIANLGAGQKIAIVDAYDDPNVASDLNLFDSYYRLPACTTANGCFKKVYASAQPKVSSGWSLEISLDVEWAHAIAPAAKIVLVEAASSSFADLLKAVDVAVAQGAHVVSMSWGGGEFSSEASYDAHFQKTGITFTAASGDSGSGVEYPASSPHVIAVGGTTLKLSSGNYAGETAWRGSGGGESAYEAEPSYQSLFAIPYDGGKKRGVPDVAYDADPNSGFSIYDSVRMQGQLGWFQVGGTSAGAPQWAALLAIVDSVRGSKGPLTDGHSALYNTASIGYSTNYHDLLSGSNGTCGNLCEALLGYDYVTGVGSPQANNLIPALASQ
jgi:subtilase family serine protease